MDTLIQADIFFFITSIAVIVLTLLLVVLVAYGVKIARTISSIANTIKEESENVIEDIADLRGKVKEEGVKVSAFWKFVTGFILNRFADKFTATAEKTSRKSRAKKHVTEDEE
ncbi:MAG: hypothetical protein QG568_163 [Patescibacteria group bacterium]|nr:hypothetical protein [Patescibacteria group bacterium]